MTSDVIQAGRQAIAVKKALELAEILDPGSEPLVNGQQELFANDVYRLAEAVVVLGRTCLKLREQLGELAEQNAELKQRMEELEARLPAESEA
jgi:phage shock protein A